MMVTKIYSTGFKLPKYTYQPSDCQASPATLSNFQEDCCIVVPVHMLKRHVNSDHVRSTPTDASSPPSNLTAPAQESLPPYNVENEEDVLDEGDNRSDETVEVEVNSLSDNLFITGKEVISEQEIELIRASIEQTSSMHPAQNLFPCPEHLPPSPAPNDIKNYYRGVMGDAFHAMKRQDVPMVHDAKKAYYIALRDAFFEWDSDKLEELKQHMRNDGMNDEMIEKEMLFSPNTFTACVPRRIVSPRFLYYRVRAVFVLFGNMKDAKSKKPLFNKRAWNSAKNLLNEILSGYYSDPPGVQWYTKRLKKDGSVAVNKYGMTLYDCSRGTNRVESFHKDLVTEWGSWPMGIEMSSKLLSEKRHRYNHRVSEIRREGFPKIGHYDTWEVEELQVLVLKNRGFLLFPNWSNSCEYLVPKESFDIVALQSTEVQEALEARCQSISPLPKLPRELQFQCQAMGTPLPFLPFSTNEERLQFSNYVHDLPDVSKIDDKQAAVDWCSFVDGLNIWPKLPVHIRTYMRKWEINQRSRDKFEHARSGMEKLAELNAIQEEADPLPPILHPPPMPQPQPQALHNEPYTVVANSVIGTIPDSSSGQKRKKRVRGKDREGTKRNPAPRRCLLCVNNGGLNFATCLGRTPRGNCEYFTP